MAGRITPIAAIGSLLKTPREAKRGTRPKRDLAPGHLGLVRKCPCISCDADPAGEAAHLRLGLRGGIGLKPDDRNVISLCHQCHAKQHRIGELRFWMALALDPVRIAEELYRASPSLEVMRAAVFAARERRK